MVLRYLVGALKKGLLYKHRNSTSLNLIGYLDSNFTGDLDKQKVLNRICVSIWRKFYKLEVRSSIHCSLIYHKSIVHYINRCYQRS